MASILDNQPKVEPAFKTGAGVGWGDQATCLFCAVARFFRPGYHNNLVSNWLPALDGVVAKLEKGAKVADVGCGHGVVDRDDGEGFPQLAIHRLRFSSEFDRARPGPCPRARCRRRIPGSRSATAKDYPEKDFDLVTFFDCLHDMGDPAGAAAHVRQSLKPDGSWMIVEPMAGDRLEDNLNPVGRIYYAGSTMVCVPTSLSQEVGAALGAQAGEAKLREVITAGGFRNVRRATETPFNMILEARA